MALVRSGIDWLGDGTLRVEYLDTRRPNRQVIDTWHRESLLPVMQVARITGIPRRTLYDWYYQDQLLFETTDEGPYAVPLAEVRRLFDEGRFSSLDSDRPGEERSNREDT